MRLLPRTCISIVATSVLLAGCGGSGDDGGTDSADGSGSGAGSLTHVDGTISAKGDDSFTLTPKAGGEPMTFSVGSSVEPVQVKALEASGAPARVSYRDGDDLVAAAVVPAPKLGEGLQSYEGTISSVDETSIVIDGADGERTFTIGPDDAASFDVAHLKEHLSQESPVRVYFDPKQPDAGVAYEDA